MFQPCISHRWFGTLSWDKHQPRRFHQQLPVRRHCIPSGHIFHGDLGSKSRDMSLAYIFRQYQGRNKRRISPDGTCHRFRRSNMEGKLPADKFQKCSNTDSLGTSRACTCRRVGVLRRRRRSPTCKSHPSREQSSPGKCLGGIFHLCLCKRSLHKSRQRTCQHHSGTYRQHSRPSCSVQWQHAPESLCTHPICSAHQHQDTSSPSKFLAYILHFRSTHSLCTLTFAYCLRMFYTKKRFSLRHS